MRKVTLVVSGTPVGETDTWAYPGGQRLGLFIVPTYRLTMTGTDQRGLKLTRTFDVMRFGVKSSDGEAPYVVGLEQKQSYTIKGWLPNYPVHSATSGEMGAWHVFGNYLIHDGPDGPQDQIFATMGCVSIIGRDGFKEFNTVIIRMSGPSAAERVNQLAEIGRARNITITYMPAQRPPLRRRG